MSTVIDQKVVEMRFDNKQFEKNVQGTMSTLDKLKAKLNLNGAAKGLENINNASNKVDMKGMSKSIDTVNAKFSALEVMGVTALANITNSVVEAGKRMVSALTIAPVSDGWQEYEMTLNAIQTTMAGTGKTAKEVQEQLKLLDIYADKTVYSTADMLNNLPKFTNAGVALEDATTAMIGIANATALAGGDASKASIAFYNLGQAIGTGYLTRMDYNSINNAGIATMEWKNQMVEAAIAAGTLKKAGDDLYEAGGKTMTIQQLFIDGLQHQWATTDVMMKVFKDYGDETTEIGKKSFAAAQDIKTFTMMMESLKATAGTGWKDTWEIIFGDLDEAKEFWTGLTNFISNIITSMADFRNNLLEGALGRSWRGLVDKIKGVLDPVKKTADSVKDVVKEVKDYKKVVDDIIRGDYKNAPDRWDLLTAAGYDWRHAQNLVNERLGYSKRYATDYKETQDGLVESQENMTASAAELITELVKLSDAQLKAKGYTEEQIAAFRELQKVSKQTGIPLKEFIENIDKIDGRWILINALKNAGQGLVSVFKAMKDAWVEIFPPMTSDQLFNIIAGFHKFSTYLVVGEETADKLKRTLKGVFAILDMALTLVTGPFKLAGKILIQFLQALDILPHDILGMTAVIGDGIVKVRDWLDSVLDLTGVFKFLAPYVKDGAAAVRDWFKGLGQSEMVKKFTSYLKGAKDAVADWIKGLKETDNIAKYIFEGLINGLKSGVKGVVSFIANVGTQMLTAIKKVLGIHSPSTEFFEIGKNMMQGLFNGVSEFVKMVYTLIMSVGSKIIDIVKSMDLGSIFTIALGSGFVYGFVKIANAIGTIASPLEEADYVVKQFGKTLKDFRGVLKAFKFRIIAESVKSFAVAVAILAGSIVVLTLVDQGEMWSAVGAITVLMVLLGALTAVAGKFGGDKGLEFGKIALTMLGLGIAMNFMAKALKNIGSIDSDKYIKAIGGFVAIMVSMITMMHVVSKKGASFAKLGSAFLGVSVAILLMSMVAKSLGKMNLKELTQGTIAVAAFGGIIVGLMAATKLIGDGKNVDNIGKSIAKIATAILMMLIVAKIAGNMELKEIIQGTIAIAAFGGIITGLMAATKLIGKSTQIAKIGSAIFGIAGAILMMVFVAKIAASMSLGDIFQGTIAVAAFGGIITGLMAATKFLTGTKNISKIGKALLTMSVAIALMGITAALLGMIDLGKLAKGVIAVGLLSVMVMGLMYFSQYAKNFMGTMIAIVSGITVLAIAMGVLSMIDPVRLASATVAIGILMGMFAVVMAAAGSVKTAWTTMLAMTGAIAALAIALGVIAQLPIEQTLAASASLSTLLLSLAGALAIISLIGSVAFAGVGALALVTLIVAGLAGVLLLMSKLDVKNALVNATALTTLLMGMSAALVVLSAVGLLGPAAFIGIAALAALIAGLLGVVVGIGALMEKIPELQNFLTTGISVLKQLASGIGEIIGSLITGFLSQVVGILPGIGASLSLFMINLAPFIAGAKTIDASVLAGIGILAGSIVLLSAANLIAGITSFLSFGSSFSDLGLQLSAFMINAMPFLTTAMTITPDMLKGVKTLAETILIITAANLVESITSFLTGGSSLESFGEELVYLATGLRGFIDKLGVITPDQLATANNAAAIIKTLAQASKDIPNSGGLLGSLVGENDMGQWAKQMPDMARGIAEFTKILTESNLDSNAITIATNAAEIIKTLAQAASEIPNTGGLLAGMIGDNDLSTFAKELPNVGKGIVGFIKTMSDGDITSDKAEVANTAAKIIKTLAQAASEIPNTGGWLADFIGDNDLSTFAKGLPKVGEGIAGFANKIGTFDDDKLATVKAAVNAIKVIATMAKDYDAGGAFSDGDSKDFTSFGSGMVKLAEKIKSFVSKMSEISKDKVSASVTKIKDLIGLATSVAETNVDSLKTFGDSLKSAGTKGVNGFVEAMSAKKPKEDTKTAAKNLLQAFIDGLKNKDKKEAIKTEAKAAGQKAADNFCTDTIKADAKSAGKNLVQGLINGLKDTEKRNQVYNAAYSLGELAVQGELDGQNSASPSKATEQAGKWLGEGLILGIKKIGGRVFGAGESMGKEASDSISNALNTALDLLNSDMDTQPTIRPVLDLSDVESGASYLSALFNNGPSVGVSSNLNAITSGMNARRQNGTNNDVVSAINKLGKDLNNSNGVTNNYNVNGVKYDDESTVADAVRTLIRAANIEGRI